MGQQKYLIKYYYIGKERYHGSQRQPNYPTIEDCIIKSLIEKHYIEDIKISNLEFASRTDRYVSARVANLSFITKKKPILMEINSSLPMSIGMYALAEVPLDFSSRFNAILRHYKYFKLITSREFTEGAKLDIKSMKIACKALLGNHNFLNFSKKGKQEIKTLRDMNFTSMKIIDDFIIFDFKSKAFLRQQIRRMVRKILEVGMGVINLEQFVNLFDTNEYISYQPSDPQGLILWDIVYEKNIEFFQDSKSLERMRSYFQEEHVLFKQKALIFQCLQKDNSGK